MLKIFPVKTYLVVKENCFIYQTIGFVLLNHDPMGYDFCSGLDVCCVWIC